MSESYDSFEEAQAEISDPEHRGKSVYWDSDHEHYEGTELRLSVIRDAASGDMKGYSLNFIDEIEGKRFGHYGPLVIEE